MRLNNMKSGMKSVIGGALPGRILAAGLALLLACGSIPALPVIPADAAGTVTVASVQDFRDLAALCTSETASIGLTVSLETDLDFSGAAFTPIPTFSGTFEGNGHTIRGISIEKAGSSTGLFRFVEKGGLVRDLTVTGQVCPGGSAKRAGGIAGVNRGTISGCYVSGSVTAKEMPGGIAGYNEETGVIQDCTNNAAVNGNSMAGGVAGKNEGTISGCKSWGAVNQNPDGAGTDDDSSMSMELNLDVDLDLNARATDFSDDLDSSRINDIGGIAGYSSGVISDCINYGDVGYEHVGYNVGGIAGRQDGVILQSRNAGAVTGRKDVGGITGQLEPELTVSYSADTLDRLEDKLDEMVTVRESLTDTVRGSVDNTSDHAEKTMDLMKDIWNRLDEMKDSRDGKQESFETDMDGYMNRLDRIYEDLDLDLINKDASHAASRLRSNANRAKQIMEELSAKRKQTASPSDALRALQDDIREEIEGIASGEVSADDVREQLSDEAAIVKSDLLETYNLFSELAGCLETMATSTAVMIDEGVNGVSEGFQEFKDDLDAMQSEGDKLYHAVRDYADELEDDLDSFDQDVSAKIDDIIDDSDLLRDDLDAEKAELRAESDRLYTQLDELRDILSDGKEKARADADELTDEDEPVFDDVSDTGNAAASTKSTVTGCSNSGSITADYQAGGIVGTVGIDLTVDEELEIGTNGDQTLEMDRTIRAIVLSCENTGEIAVKKDYAGGIAGRVNVGALVGNSSLSDVSSEDGDYVGGIAGSSRNSLRANAVRGTITGTDYVGGIAGYGTDVKDNYSMADVMGEGELHGSIAGDADADGAVSGNLYVDEGLGAVDGITYAAQAAAITAGEMLARPEIPEDFRSVTVSFFDSESVLMKKITLDYGQTASADAYPELPKKSGFYFEWEDVDLTNLRQDKKVYAICEPLRTVIASDDSLTPLLLAEGGFQPGTAFTAAETTAEDAGIDASGLSVKAVYTYAISDPENGTPETVTLRARIPDGMKNAAVRIVSEGSAEGAGQKPDSDSLTQAAQEGNQGLLQEVESETDGSYLVFTAPAAGTVVIVSGGLPVPVWGLAAGVILILAAAIALMQLQKGRKRR